MPAKKGKRKPTGDMFDAQARARTQREAPLAARMRPRTFDEFLGQEHLVGEGRMLRKSIETDQVPSMVFWGPPGSGKTTLARIVASLTQSHFAPISAVTAGVADLRTIVDEAQQRRGMYNQRTILFIDEIHRFNKAQQDVILPYVEDGVVTLIGATTENPSFEVISPLLSRCRVYTLNPLSPEQIEVILRRAIADDERGLAHLRPHVDDDALAGLAQASGGDARIALNALELAAATVQPDDSGVRPITLSDFEEALQRRTAIYDKAGDYHYDTISAFIKSMRGSDPDAALYWLARMLEAGEDPLFVARRMVILAAEDVGLADPQALVVAMAAQQAVHFVGMPEGFLPLAEAVIYLASAPKSNSALAAYEKARRDVRETRNEPVPLHLRNPVTDLMKQKGYGKDYKYAHHFPDHYVPQQFLPDKLRGRRYYDPSDQGFERTIRERLRRLRDESEPQD
ncbi:MAG: replication-associated recombination protein A [Dehalococcoidia bacterium]|nr:MAG: replication-associated recombination protein A [Dehalococcoidia bacterium]